MSKIYIFALGSYDRPSAGTSICVGRRLGNILLIFKKFSQALPYHGVSVSQCSGARIPLVKGYSASDSTSQPTEDIRMSQ